MERNARRKPEKDEEDGSNKNATEKESLRSQSGQQQSKERRRQTLDEGRHSEDPADHTLTEPLSLCLNNGIHKSKGRRTFEH